jgi:hypothetical protein
MAFGRHGIWQAWHLMVIDVHDSAVADGCRNMILAQYPDTVMN